MRFRFLLLPLSVMLVSGVLVAQSIVPNNDPIPECTPQDADVFVDTLKEAKLVDNIQTLTQRLDTDKKDDYAWAVDSVIMLRRIYERDIVPALPDCALVIRWRLHFESMQNGLGLAYAGAHAIDSGTAPDSLDDRLPALTSSIGESSKAAGDYLNALVALAEDAE